MHQIRIIAFLAVCSIQPQLSGIKFTSISNLSGHISLYRMNYGGSVLNTSFPPHRSAKSLIGGILFCLPKPGIDPGDDRQGWG